MFKVRVNATSANVCVGFDVLGIALALANEFTFDESNDFEFYGFDEIYCTKENNMVYDSYVKTFEYANKCVIPVKISFSGEIPVCRGLGSSSSLIVAGVFAANHMMKDILSYEECLNVCTEIEGHPDNVAPAIYGGLVASFKSSKGYKSINYPVSEDLKFITIIPPFKLSTHEARSVLPHDLEISDVVSNLSRIVNVPLALKDGNVELLKELFVDKIHEPYRGRLIPGYDLIKDVCSKENVAFAISGSGSTMLVIAKDCSIVKKLEKFNYQIKVLKIGSGVVIEEE